MPNLSTVSSFVFIGGHPAVDFLNTQLVRGGEPVDLLQSPDDLRRWLAEAKLGRVENIEASTLRKAKELRAATRRLLQHVRRKDVDAINAALARGRGSFRVEVKKDV